MSEPGARRRLPRYDFVLIPFLVGLTLVFLAGLGEALSRQFFIESGKESCSSTGARGEMVMKPNCTSYRQAAEGPPTSSVYNECGYRAPEPCGDRSPGTIRVALMGASTAHGFKVRYEDTFGARLTRSLTEACRRPVEFQNMGVGGATLLDIYRRLPDALAMKPDLIMLVITPYDMRNQVADEDIADRNEPAKKPFDPVAGKVQGPKSLITILSDMAYESRMLVVAQHYLFQHRPTFVRLFLLHGEEVDYLRPPMGPGWARRIRNLDTIVGDMADRAHAAGVPMMLVETPQRIQVSLLDPTVRQPGQDPYAIGRELAALSAKHGMYFDDTLDAFAEEPDSDEAFYNVDGHIDGRGHGLVARSVERALERDVPVFQECQSKVNAGRS